MKTNIYTITLGLMSAGAMQAQITLTQANNAPASGDVQSSKYLDSIAILDKSSGASKTWNYTSSVQNSTNTAVTMVTYTTASSIPGASMFTSAGANVAATDSSEFYKSTSTSLEMMGNMAADGTTMFFSNTMKVMQFPFTYGNSFTDNFSGTLTIPSAGGTLNITGNISTSADGYGTVILPSTPSNLSFSNVLRVKSTNTMYISGTLFSIPITGTVITSQYLYFKSGTKSPFFQIMYQHTDIPAFGSPSDSYNISYDATLPVNVQEINAHQPSIFIFPNPTKDILNVQMNKSDYKKVQIIDLQGKLIIEKNIPTTTDIESIDIKQLPAGTYIVNLIGSELGLSDISYKFIKE